MVESAVAGPFEARDLIARNAGRERLIFFGVFKRGMMLPWRSHSPARCHRYIALFAP